MRPRFDQVLIFGPEGVTGGPECCHQLGHAINRLGGKALMVYTGPFSKTHVSPTDVYCALNPESHGFRAYQAYEPIVKARTVLTPQSLLFFPEFHVNEAMESWRLTNCPTACWWLGVPTGLQQVEPHDFQWRREFFRAITHFYQSYHALEYLREWNAKKTLPLFDYTSDDFARARTQAKIPKSIAYFPNKGRDLAEKFFRRLLAEMPEISLVPIQGMTKSEVAQALARAMLYIDFGEQPGKDRVPREAAAAGTIVLLHREGAARFYEDAALSPLYKFNTNETDTDVLVAHVRDILLLPEPHFAAQSLYREQIAHERAEFELQVQKFFFLSE